MKRNEKFVEYLIQFRREVVINGYGETELSDPFDADGGEIGCDPDEYDIEEGITAVDKAVKFIFDSGGMTPSCSQFSPGVWYSENHQVLPNGDDCETSLFLKGFTEDEQREIFEQVQRLYRDPTARPRPTF